MYLTKIKIASSFINLSYINVIENFQQNVNSPRDFRKGRRNWNEFLHQNDDAMLHNYFVKTLLLFKDLRHFSH